MKLFNRQSGLTLIEMMIAMLIGLIVSGAVLTTFITTVSTNAAAMKMVKLNQELRTSMTLISRDIRRTGHWGTVVSNSPYLDDIEIVGGNCILLAYDDPSVSGNDFIGYKLENGIIKRASANAAFTCASGTWAEMTDPDTNNISTLNFDMRVRIIGDTVSLCTDIVNEDCSIDLTDATSDLRVYLDAVTGTLPSGYIVEVDVSVTGNSISDTTLRRSMTETLRIRNNGLL